MHLVCPACAATNRIPDERLGDDPRCGRCGAALMAPEPIALADATLPRFIAKTELPVLVDFWAGWCQPCHQMAPHFAAAATQRPHVRFAKVDSDASPGASTQHAIRSLPTMVMFRGGVEVARQSGAMPSGQIVAWVDRVLGR